MFRERPFLGVGVGGYLNVVDPVAGERRVAHNVFLSILVELGLIGLVLFLTMIFALLGSVRYMEKDERVLWMLLVATYLVGGFFLTWEHSKQTWLIMDCWPPGQCPFELHSSTRRRTFRMRPRQ